VLLIPAIDLLEGQAVRLAEGDRERVTVYDADPPSVARRFAESGARQIHVVDLDGAFAGKPAQLELIRRIVDEARAAGVKVEVGGGVRSREAVETLLSLGVDQVVVGTLAIRDPEAVRELCERHPGAIIVAIDARDGMVAVDGWREISTVEAATLAAQAEAWGAGALLYTDVSRDGLQVGANVPATADLQRSVSIPVIASGGVGKLEDLDALREAGVRAVIFGRALYEGSFTLEEALQRC
jgi:phosphoribosylformimino-5-aminoimidazole carboxamide ribotide isomerase